tara:strand:+ start:2034 stop:2225 length:192 start_codon:yes stop_codon:yes gene_type:complete
MSLTLKYGQDGAILLDLIHFLLSENKEITYKYLHKSTRIPMGDIKMIVNKMEYEEIIKKGTVK